MSKVPLKQNALNKGQNIKQELQDENLMIKEIFFL